MGFAIFAGFAGFDALAERAGLEVRALFVGFALGVVRALFVSFAMVIVRPALATLTARAARAALEALAFDAFAIVAWARFTGLADLVATLAAAFVALAFFVILDAAFADFADFFAELRADFEDPVGFVDFAPRFVPLVALRFFGTAAPEPLPPTAAPSNEPCGKPQPISNCSAMRR